MNEESKKDDEFKLAFKYYKQKKESPSFDDVVDFKKEKNFGDLVSELNLENPVLDHQGKASLEINSNEKWKAYQLNNIPGFFYITNVFSEENEKYWCQQCLKTYSRSPYETNLDAHHPKDVVDNMWDMSRQTIEDAEVKSLQLLKGTPIWNLRWSTLGFHYGWSTKSYEREKKSIFPQDLSDVFSYIASSVGFHSFKPESAIVNYYHVGSRLTPHNDISEIDLQKPLLSISFGLPSIFLIGGATRDVKPTAIMIRPRDALIMSGQSRIAFHALPRVLTSDEKDSESDTGFSLYMKHSRININVRQVESEAFPLNT